MDYPRPRPATKRKSFLPKSSEQLIRESLACCHTGQACLPGLSVLNKLQSAIDMLPLTEEFEINGSSRIETCQRPCHVVWQISLQESWLFGDVDPEADIGTLIDQITVKKGPDVSNAGPEPAAMIFASAGVLQ